MEVREQRILKLDPGLLLQRLKCLKIVLLSEVFQTQSYRLLLPEVLVPGLQPLDQAHVVVPRHGDEPDGVVEGGSMRPQR